MWANLWIMSAAISGLVVPTVEAAHTYEIHSRQASNTGTISWTTCPDVNSTQCAFLEVPMDYTNPNNNVTVSIFLRNYPATVPAEQRLGSILFNPGGPGGSGSGAVASMGDNLSKMVDGRYDIIGFDPRAVNLTGPSTACHDVELKFMERAYDLHMQGVPLPHISGAAEIAHVAKVSAIQSSHNAACVQNGNHEMLRNSGTVAVVKDMERIVQALGEDGLNYIGWSYGTIIGATFAAIRPNLVKRMVLDGVWDAQLYSTDTLEWGRSWLQDTPKTYAGFISTCIEAGPAQCALAITKQNKTETVEGLEKRLDALYTKLGREPLVFGDSPVGPGILQAHNVQLVVFSFLYIPGAWQMLAEGLALLEQGDGLPFYSAINGRPYGIVPESYFQNVFNRSMQKSSVATRESQYPIMCGDLLELNITVEEYAEYFREMRNLSPMGEQPALIIGGCRGWSFRATERYTGPWTTERGLNKTRFPILFINLDADPVTPLPSAVKMSRGFGLESASLLIQQGFGHPSNAHPSLCTAKNIRDYFVDGKVPENGTYCTPEPGWIYPRNDTNAKRSMLDKRDKELLEAVERIGRERSWVPIGP
ncbi:Alpha/Beta hydrolase protein [Rhizoctonia solani]|nr:Alpha/Beta hydrolase protein [Rhizoctonia solani]